MSSGVISEMGLGSVSCSDSFDPVLPRVSCLIRLPETTLSSLALFMLLVLLKPVVHSGQVGVGWSCHCSYCRPQLHRCRVTMLVVASPIATIQFLACRMWICCRKSIFQLRTAYSVKNSREKWRKWISLTGSLRWPSASANHRQTG